MDNHIHPASMSSQRPMPTDLQRGAFDSSRLMDFIGVDFIGGLALRLRAIALEQHWPHPHYNLGVSYLYATCLMFRTAFDFEPIPLDYIDGYQDELNGTHPILRRPARVDRRRLEGIGETIGTDIVRLYTDREGHQYPVDMWYEASEIVTPSLTGVYRERHEWSQVGIPVHIIDQWAMETMVRAWVHLSRHGEFDDAASQIAEVGLNRWGARWEFSATQFEQSEVIEEICSELNFDPKF